MLNAIALHGRAEGEQGDRAAGRRRARAGEVPIGPSHSIPLTTDSYEAAVWGITPWRWERRRAQKMAMPKEKDPRRPGISDEQHQRVLAHSPNWRFALTAELCRATMHRMNSVRQLRKKDVDLRRGRVRWRGEHDKTGRELVTPLTPEAVEAVRNAPVDVLSPWLIPAETDPSRPVSRSVLNEWMQRVKERAGMDGERLGFHAYKRAGIRTKAFRALPPKGAGAAYGHDARDAQGGVRRSCLRGAWGSDGNASHGPAPGLKLLDTRR